MVVFLGAYRNSSSSQGKQYPAPPHGEYNVINTYLAVEKMESRNGLYIVQIAQMTILYKSLQRRARIPHFGVSTRIFVFLCVSKPNAL